MEKRRYDFNFFKPTSAFARDNTRVITAIILVWAVAVFGFHVLMRVVEKPVPEAHYVTFEEIWPRIQDGTAGVSDHQAMARIYLNLMGRFITLRNDDALRLVFTATVHDLLPADAREAFLSAVASGPAAAASALAPAYAAIGVTPADLLGQVVPYAVTAYDGKPLSASALETIPGIMEKHLIHFRSAITDARVLGFPLPYFYTAVFLLVLFVVLCIIYCKIIDQVAKRHGIEADEVK